MYRGRWRTAENYRLGDNVEEPGSGRIGPRGASPWKAAEPDSFEWS
ncbi:hypothetical protein NE634_16005 [Lacrimispora saccharolytica]|nr:hypothetical protein [Lacrimispora saccharolytica]